MRLSVRPPAGLGPRLRRRAVTGATVGLVALVALAATMTGCTDDAPSPIAADPTPAVDVCRSYDFEAMLGSNEESAPVPCADGHTAETIVVTDDALPAPSTAGTWTDRQLEKVGEVACTEAQHARAMKLDPAELATTRLSRAYFAPTPRQAKAGARWVRCDSILLDGAGLALVSGRHRDLVATPGAFARCATTPSTDAVTEVRCDPDQTGQFVAVGAVPARVRDAVGSPAEVQRIQADVVDACHTKVEAATDLATVSATDASLWRVTLPGTDSDGFALCWLRLDEWTLQDEPGWPDEQPLGDLVQA